MQEYFFIYFIKEKQLLQTKRKDTLQFHGEREKRNKQNKKKLKLEAYSSPGWYEVTKQLRHECSKRDFPIAKNRKRRRINFPF